MKVYVSYFHIIHNVLPRILSISLIVTAIKLTLVFLEGVSLSNPYE